MAFIDKRAIFIIELFQFGSVVFEVFIGQFYPNRLPISNLADSTLTFAPME